MKRNIQNVLLIALLAVSQYSLRASTLYVADGTGWLNTFDGSGSLINHDAEPNFFSPNAVVVRGDGHVFVSVASAGDGVVDEFDAAGNFLSVLFSYGSGGIGIASGMAFGADGDLYVADAQNNLVNKYDSVTGAFLSTVIPFNALSSPGGMKFDSSGNLYITDADGIEKWDGSTLTNFASINGAPVDIAIGPDGNFYVTDVSGFIRVFDSTGTETRQFGAAYLDQPIGLAFGSDGNVYVTGNEAHTGAGPAVMEFNPTTGDFIQDFVTYNGTDTFVIPGYLAFSQDAVPEPSTWALGLIGIAALAAIRMRRGRA